MFSDCIDLHEHLIIIYLTKLFNFVMLPGLFHVTCCTFFKTKVVCDQAGSEKQSLCIMQHF